MNIDNITNIKRIITNRRIVHVSILSCFIMLVTVKSYIFPDHNRYRFASESFPLNSSLFVALITQTYAKFYSSS